LPHGLSLVEWYGLVCGIFVYAIAGKLGALPRLRYSALFVLVSSYLLLYILLHIMVYTLALYTFSALTLDSYDRLMAIFLGAFLLVGFACTILPLADFPARGVLSLPSGLGAPAVALALLILQAPSLDRIVHPQPKAGLRTSMEPMLRTVDRHVDPHRKVYIVAQNTTGFAYWILRYELIPRPVNPWNWTLGRKRCENDLWNDDISSDEWANRLIGGKFEFVLIAESNDEFWAKFRSLFQVGSTDAAAVALYKVGRGSSGAVQLIPVAETEQRALPRMAPDTGTYGINFVCGK
jgi:hypothetical protein